MKKQLIALIMIAIAPAAIAQILPEKFLLGGCVGFDSQTTESEPDDFKESSYSFAPQVLYSFTDKWMGGIKLDFEGTKEEPSDIKTSDTRIGPIVRYQFNWLEKASCYTQFGLSFGGGKQETPDSYYDLNTNTQVDYIREDKYSHFGAMIAPGFNYQLKPSWFIDFRYGNLSYASQTWKPDDTENTDVEDYKVNSFDFNLSLKSARVGFLYQF